MALARRLARTRLDRLCSIASRGSIPSLAAQLEARTRQYSYVLSRQISTSNKLQSTTQPPGHDGQPVTFQEPAIVSAPSAIPPDSTEKPQPRRSFRPLIYATAFLVLGLSAGKIVSAVILPPPFPGVDTPEDDFFLSSLRKDVNELPLVQELRAHRDDWLEYDAYMSQSPELRESSLTAGTLRGSQGLGIQRIFWNKKEKRSISILFFGGSTAGWPGITHGGVIATIMLENLERVANGPDFGPGMSRDMEVEQLKMNYLKPSHANRLYVVRAEIDGTEDTPYHEGKSIKVKATMENVLTGLVCAEASGQCSKTQEVNPLKNKAGSSLLSRAIG